MEIIGGIQVSGSIDIYEGVLRTIEASGSFSGSGRDLYDIQAEAIVGLVSLKTGSVTASVHQINGFTVVSEESGSTFSGSIKLASGSVYSGSGAQLYDIPASGIVGLNLGSLSSGSVTASIDFDSNGSSSFHINTDTVITGSLEVSGGTFSGSGANLYDISASAIVGLNLAVISSGSGTASINIDGNNTSSFHVNTNTVITGSLTVLGGINGVDTSLISSGSGTASIKIDGDNTSSLHINTNTIISGSLNVLGGIQGVDTSLISSGSATASIKLDVSGSSSLQINTDTYITGALWVSGGMVLFGDMTIYGTQSVEYITSSQLNIGTNIISVNTDTPAVRFGGLAVYDSGSTGRTGSLLWDSERNNWIYTNPSGSAYDGGVVLMGPTNESGSGNEQTINQYAVVIGEGSHHLTSSALIVSESKFISSIPTIISQSLSVTGAYSIVGNSTFSGSIHLHQSASVSGTNIFGTASNAFSASFAVQSRQASFTNINSTAINGEYALMFAATGATGYLQAFVDTAGDILRYNPSNGRLIVGSISASIGFTGSLFGTASNALTASFVRSKYAREIHVSSGSGDDISGSGDFLQPFKTIGKAIATVTSGQQIIIHPGTYPESFNTPTNCNNVTITAANTEIGGLVNITGTASIDQTIATVRLVGLNLGSVIHSGNKSLYLQNVTVGGALTKTGDGYLQATEISVQAGLTSVTGAGQVVIKSSLLGVVLVNNASALANLSNNIVVVTPTCQAGTMLIDGGVVYSTGNLTGAVFGSAGAVVALKDVQCLTPNGGSARITLNVNTGTSIQNVSYDRANSVLGVSLVTRAHFQHIQGDAITGSGLFLQGNVAAGASLISSHRITGSVGITGSFTVFSRSNPEFRVLDDGTFIGNAQTDTHRITGSVGITGSLGIVGNVNVHYPAGSTQTTGSNIFGTASWATDVVNKGASVTVSGSFPTGSSTGSLWWNTDDGNLYIQVENPSGSEWVPATNTVAGGEYGATADFSFPTAATTWNIPHNFGTTTPIVQFYTGSQMLIPASVRAVDANNLEATFAVATHGVAKVSTGVGSATSASFAITASLANTASVLPNQATSIQAVNTTTQTFANLQSTTITGWTNQIATNAGEWNASTGIFTSARPGTYLVACSLQLASHTYAGANSEVSFFTTISSGGIGGGVARFFNQVTNYSGLTPTLQFNSLVRFTAADQTMRIQVYNATGNAMSNFTANNGTAITMQEISSTVSR